MVFIQCMSPFTFESVFGSRTFLGRVVNRKVSGTERRIYLFGHLLTLLLQTTVIFGWYSLIACIDTVENNMSCKLIFRLFPYEFLHKIWIFSFFESKFERLSSSDLGVLSCCRKAWKELEATAKISWNVCFRAGLVPFAISVLEIWRIFLNESLQVSPRSQSHFLLARGEAFSIVVIIALVADAFHESCVRHLAPILSLFANSRDWPTERTRTLNSRDSSLLFTLFPLFWLSTASTSVPTTSEHHYLLLYFKYLIQFFSKLPI